MKQFEGVEAQLLRYEPHRTLILENDVRLGEVEGHESRMHGPRHRVQGSWLVRDAKDELRRRREGQRGD
jgi:hypothetical protein